MLFVAALIVGGIGVRRLRDGGGAGLLKATMVITLVLLAAFVVAVWAMSGKARLTLSVHRHSRPEAGSAGREATGAFECTEAQGRGPVGETVGCPHA